MPLAVTCPPIHSMVVVTSPSGDQAPPALAAITTTPDRYSRSSRAATSLRSSEIMTMVVVRLSSTGLRKKVTAPTIHISETMRFRPDAIGDRAEAVVAIDHRDHGHRAHQEEGDLGGVDQ